MRWVGRLPLFPLLAGVSLAIGFAVPVVYELFEKPGSRSRIPSMERAALVTLVLTVVVCTLVAVFRKPPELPAAGRRKLQFGLRALFAATTVAAILAAAAKWLDAHWASAVVATVALIVLAVSFRRDPQTGWRAAALVASLFCPFVWMIAYSVPFGRTSGLVEAIPVGPGILPAGLVRASFDLGLSVDGMLPVAGLFVIAELVVGGWLAGRGGKLFVAYTMLVLLAASLSSLAMHALYRM